jgi:hypothetical protein
MAPWQHLYSLLLKSVSTADAASPIPLPLSNIMSVYRDIKFTVVRVKITPKTVYKTQLKEEYLPGGTP